MYAALFFYRGCTQCASYQSLYRHINGYMYTSHPNILPVIRASKRESLFWIVNPWMPDGNIIQYTQMNPGVDRLMLVCVHPLEAQRGQPTDSAHNSSHKRATASCIFTGCIFSMVPSLR
jgi:hypothetical protein